MYVTCYKCGYKGHISSWTIVRGGSTLIIQCPKCHSNKEIQKPI